MLGHGGGGRRTRSCFEIPRASLGIWKMMPRIREVLRGGRSWLNDAEEARAQRSASMDPDTRRDPSWASSISLIRSASRPPGFRNARHPLFLARPLLFIPRLILFTIASEEDPSSLSRVRGLKHEADTRWRDEDFGWAENELVEWIIDEEDWSSHGSELISLRWNLQVILIRVIRKSNLYNFG